MPIEPAGLVTGVIAGLALMRGRDACLIVFVCSTLFGAAAAFNGSGLGSIQPAQVLLAVLVLVVGADRAARRHLVESLRPPAPAFWLLCTWAYGLLGALFMPRLLLAAFYVNPVGVSVYGEAAGQVPFGPTTGNLSQTIYFTGDLACFLAISAIVETPRGVRIVANALLLYCAGDVALALLDLATFYTGTASLLDGMRNAKYVIYVDTDDSALKRIIGSFTEASAFASASLGALGFCYAASLARPPSRIFPLLALALLGLLLFSTSSTGYVGLGCCAALAWLRSVAAVLRSRASAADVAVATIAPATLAAALIAITLHPQTAQTLGDFFNAVLFDKAASQSGLERGLLNTAALANVGDTAGLGTGFGGVRTSSFPLAVLANLGLPGSAAFGIFLVSVMRPRHAAVPLDLHRSQSAARAACGCLLIAATISGALVDLGLPFFIFAALACARPRAEAEAIPERRARGIAHPPAMAQGA